MVGLNLERRELSIDCNMRAISISRCDVVVPVGAVVNDLSSLGDTSVPASSAAWFKIGKVRILVIARVRAWFLKLLSVIGAFISGG